MATNQSVELINQALDHIKRREGLTSDAQLAKYLNTYPMIIFRLRRGEISSSFSVLAPHLVQFGSEKALQAS